MSRTRKIERRVLPSGLVTYRAPYIDAAGDRRSKNFPTRRAAQDFLLTVAGELRLGVHTPSTTSPTIAEAAELWIADCHRRGLEPTTIDNYETHLELHVLPLLAEVKLSALTTPAVRAFADQLHEAGRSTDMVKRVLVSLGSIFRIARERGLVATAPTSGINRKKDDRDNPRPKIPNKQELKSIIAAATEHGPRWRAIILVLIFCGLRASELRGLRWVDVDLTTGMLHVTQRADAPGRIGKLKSKAGYRSITLPTEALEALRVWKLMCPHSVLGLAFPAARGKVASYNSLKADYEPIQIAAKVTTRDGDRLIGKFGMHALRHACISLWIEAGLNPKQVQAAAGHASIELTFTVYGHLFHDDDANQRAAARMQSALLGGYR
jgi:integrase